MAGIVALQFTASLAKLLQEPKWQADNMSQVLDRLHNGFTAIQKDMSLDVATHVMDATLIYLMDLTPFMVGDIGNSHVYQRLLKRTRRSVSISYSDWFWLSCLYGPGNCKLDPFRV